MSNTRKWPVRSAHSMTIGGKHTFRDWSMIPADVPVFAPPAPRIEQVEVPGASGLLDYTEVLTGAIAYDNRSGSFTFYVLADKEWNIAYSEVLNFLQGRRMNCILDDDPAFFYTGRFWVDEWASRKDSSTIVISYNVDPYKYSTIETGTHDWLWNDLFDNIIYYGTFSVNGEKYRNLINPSGSAIVPKFTCTEEMEVELGNRLYTLPSGTTETPGFALVPGDNYCTFRGNGNVLVDYSIGKEL